MRLIMGFIFYLVYLLTLNVNAYNFNDTSIQNAEIKLVEIFQRKATEFKKEFPLSLIEKNLLTITKENLKLQEYDIFKFFQWRNDIFVAAANSSETLISLVIFEENLLNLKFLYSFEHSSFIEDIDIFKVIVENDILWIFEASRGSKVVKVVKINLNHIGSEGPLTQLILSPSQIQEVFPFMDETLKLVLITKEDLYTGISIYFQDDEFLVKIFDHLDERNVLIKPMFASSGLYFAFINRENTTLMVYENNTSILKEIKNVEKNLVDILIYEDELVMSEFLVLVEPFKTEIYLLKNNKLFYWNRIFTDEKIEKGHVFSYEFINFISLTSKENVSVYAQNSYEAFNLEWKFATCGDTKETYDLKEGEIYFIIHCDSITYLKRFEAQNGKVSEMYNDHIEDISLRKCLNEMEELMKENTFRIPQIKNTLHKKFLHKTEDKVESSPKLMVQSSRLGALSASVDDLKRKLDELLNKTKNIEDELQNLLTFKNEQHIEVSFNVDKMVANYSIILLIDLEQLNGRSFEEYKTNFLTLDKDQFVNASVYFDQILTDNVNTKSFSSNGLTILVENLFDVTKPNQVVSGYHSFSSIEVKNSISKGNSKDFPEINGLDVNTFVTKESNVQFEGRVTFSQLLKSEEELNLQYLNEADYEVWSRSVLKTSRDPKLPFGGSITVDGNVIVHGNVKASSINGIDFSDLYKNVAKRSNRVHYIKDKIEFQNKLSVENLEVQVVNDLKWNAFLRKRDETITASFNVDDGLVTKDLNSDSINGLDLDKEVLLSGPDQTLKGRIMFVEDVEVKSLDGVTMDPGATINEIDPSLHTDVGQQSNQQIFNKKLNLGEVLTVNGSIRFTKINGKEFPDFKNHYWSKSRPQQIPQTVTIRNANFRKSFYASTLNGTKINDFIFTNIPQTISGSNFFVANTLIRGNVYMENNKTIDRVDISFLKENAMNLHEQQEINGLHEFLDGINVKHFETKASYPRGFNVEDFIMAPFKLSNGITFKGAVEAHYLHAVDLNIDKINEREALSSIIKEKTPISEIKGNLFSKKLKVNDLAFTKSLNGRDFDTWYKKVVRKTKPNQGFPKALGVLGDITFNGSIDVDILNSRKLKSFLSKIVEDCERCAVRGKKMFLKPIEVQGNLFADFINGVNLNELKERLLSKTKEQTIKGKYLFNSGLTAVTVQVNEISGIPIDEVILTDNISVPYPITFKNAKFENLYSKEGWIDGCQISQIFNPPTTQVRDLVFSNVTFGHLDLNGDVNLNGKAFVRLINKDFLSFLKDIVSKTEQQTILGSTFFKSQVSVQNLKADFVNKYSYEEFLNKLNQIPTVVKTDCDMTFDNLYVNKMISEEISAETVNDLPLKQISDSGIKKDYQGVIKGPKRFLNVFVRGNLKFENINDQSFDDLVKIKGQNENLKLVFTNPIYIKKNLNVHGYIAEDDASSLFKHFKNGNSSTSSPFPPNYETLIVEGDLLVNSVNGLNISDILLKSDKFPIITGKKNLIGGISVEGESRIRILNGLHLHRFQDWPNIFTNVKPERQSYGNYEENSIPKNKILLGHQAFDVTRINEINSKFSKGLHRKLFSITAEDKIQLPGDQIRALRKGHSNNFNVFVQYNPCLEKSLCPCFETYSMKMRNNSKLLIEEDLVKGLNIQIVDEVNSKLFSFITRCSADQASTTVIEVHKSEEFSDPVVVTKTENYGLVQEVLPFHINGKAYLIMTSLKERNLISIKTLNINFKTVWEKDFLAEFSKVQVKMIHGNCYLLVVVNKEPQNVVNHSSFEGTKLYLWNPIKESFVLLDSFPLAETGDIISFGYDSYLVLGFNGKIERRNCKNSGADLQIYRSSGKSLFSPFTSLPVTGISSSVFFTVENDLYLAVASVAENSVSIYRMINHEGFAIQESLYFASPSEMHYINVNNQHFLLLLEYKTRIVLLKLHFKGVSFE